MPFLDICDSDGNIQPFASGKLFATMLYPGATESEERNQIFRELLLRGFEVDSVILNLARLSKAARRGIDEIRIIALNDRHRNAGIGNVVLLDQATHRGAPGHRGAAGMLAGMILRFLLRCLQHSPEHATLNKAYFVVDALAHSAAESDVKIGIGVGETKLAQHWKIHKAGCHLQAAALALDLDGSDWLATENIPAFIDVSEIYRFAGEAAGFLDPSLTWRPPPAFPTMPSPEMKREGECGPAFAVVELSAEVLDLLFPPLHHEELKILKTYRSD